MVNKNLLRSKMVSFGDTYQKLADALGITRSNLSNKVNNKLVFNNRETTVITKRYKLNKNEIVEIFGFKNECN